MWCGCVARRVVEMRLVSWNVRGLGGVEKRRAVKMLVREKSPSVICIQETKLMVCDGFVCSSLWGGSSFDYSYRPSVGASGGVLTMWDTTEVEVWPSYSQDHMLQIYGRVLRNNEEFYLINIYAPCDLRAKEVLWAALSAHLQSLRGQKVCVCGDFNAVRKSEERRFVRGGGVTGYQFV